jgi:hypothetical protein
MSKVGQVGHTGSEVGQTHFLGVKSWQDCDLEKWGTISRGKGPKKDTKCLLEHEAEGARAIRSGEKQRATKTLAARAGATASVPLAPDQNVRDLQ